MDSDETWSGSTVTSLDFDTCASSQLRNSDGSTFTFPPGYYTGWITGTSTLGAGTAWQLTSPSLSYQMDAAAINLQASTFALVTRTGALDESP